MNKSLTFTLFLAIVFNVTFAQKNSGLNQSVAFSASVNKRSEKSPHPKVLGSTATPASPLITQWENHATTGESYVLDIANDAKGNTYVTGKFTGTMPVGVGVFISNGDTDAFVIKYGKNGVVKWAKQIGGISCDVGSGITVDNKGNICVTGSFTGAVDFDGNLVSGLHANSQQEIFLVKYDSSGIFQWVRRQGAILSDDRGMSVAADTSGNIYLTGYYGSNAGSALEGDSLQPDSTTHTIKSISSYGINDYFISKYTAQGLVAWRNTGETDYAGGRRVAVDAQGNSYITGAFKNNIIIDQPADAVLSAPGTGSGTPDLYLVKYNTWGKFKWAKQASSQNAEGTDLILNSSGELIVTGSFTNSATFGAAGILTTTGSGDLDFFIVKCDNAGTFLWAQQSFADQLVGSHFAIGNALRTDKSGNIYVAAFHDFNSIVGTDTLDGTKGNFLISSYNASGNWQWTKDMLLPNINGISSSTGQRAVSMSIDSSDNIFIGSAIKSFGFMDCFYLSNAGSYGMMLARFKIVSITTQPLSASIYCAGDSISIPFTVTDTLCPSNVYVAELSDSTGSFTNSTTLLNDSSDSNAGTIKAKLPPKLKGTKFRVRVSAINTSTLPYEAITGTDNGTDITIKPLPQAPVSISGKLSVCKGDTAVVYKVPAVSSVIGYNWVLPSGASIKSGNNTDSITVSFSGIATSGNVIAKTINGCGLSPDSVYSFVTVNSIPAIPTVSSQTICAGNQATLNPTAPGGTYQWYDAATAGVLRYTGAPVTTSVLNADTTYYVSTIVSGCESQRKTVTVTVTPLAAPSSGITGPSVVCLGDTHRVYIIPVVTGQVSNNWNLPFGFSAKQYLGTNFDSIVVKVSGTAVSGNITYTPANSCGDGPNVLFFVTVNSVASPVVSGETICYGNTATLIATSPGGVYQWYDDPVTGNVKYTGDSIITSPLTVDTTFYVQTTLGGCTSQRTPVTVTVLSAPAAPSANDTTICAGNSATLSASGSAGTYQWYDALSGGTQRYSGSIIHTSILSADSTYYVQTTVGSCSSQRTPVTVTILSNPSSPSVPGTTICSGTSATLSASGSSGTYEWYDSPSGGVLRYTGSTISTPVLTADTTYYVLARSGNCISTRTPVTVTVTPLPAAPGVPGKTICAGNSASLTASGSTGTYEWFDAASGGTLRYTGATINTSVLNSDTTYYVQATVSGCSGPRAVVTVTVLPAPSAPVVPGTTICSGNAATLTASGSSGTYEWYDTASGGVQRYAGSTITTSILAVDTTYYVQTTVTGCASQRTSVTVTVLPSPAAPTVPGTGICSGNQATLVASGSSGTYAWYDQLSAGTLRYTGSTITTSILTADTTYYVQTIVAGCPSQRTPVTVTVTPIPAIPVSSGKTICAGNSAVLTASGSSGTYQWYDSSTGGGLKYSGATINTSVLYSDTTLYVQGAIGSCTSSRVAVTVTVNPSPVKAVITITGSNPFCKGSSVLLTSSSISNNTWSDGSTGQSLTVSNPGNYFVTVNNSFGCSTTSDISTITETVLQIVLTSPTYDGINNISKMGASDGSINLTVTGGTPVYTFSWSTAATTQNISQLNAGKYSVVVTDASGCSWSDSIVLKQPSLLELPTGFSPNADGKNDYYKINGIEGYPDNSLSVFNRWGDEVYSRSNYKNEWDGKSKQNEDLPDGTYFVLLKVKSNDGEIVMKEYVVIVR